MAKTILIVDDSPTEMHLMMNALKTEGFNIITAIDGEEALQKADQFHPDLILLDVILPNSNGFEICRRLKTSPSTKDIKVILVTSKDQESDKFWGMKQGADEYITKPFVSEYLISSVNKFI